MSLLELHSVSKPSVIDANQEVSFNSRSRQIVGLRTERCGQDTAFNCVAATTRRPRAHRSNGRTSPPVARAARARVSPHVQVAPPHQHDACENVMPPRSSKRRVAAARATA